MQGSRRTAAAASVLTAALLLGAAACSGCTPGSASERSSAGGESRRGAANTATLPGSAAPLAPTAAAHLDPAIAQRFLGQSRQRVIVHLRDPLATAREQSLRGAAKGQAAARRSASAARRADHDARKRRLLRQLAARAGGPTPPRVVHHYRSFALLALEVDERELGALASLPDVVSVVADGEHEATTDTSVAFIDAATLHDMGVDGQGTAVAVLDFAVQFWEGHFGTCPEEGSWIDDTPGCAIAAWRNYNSHPEEPDSEPEDDPYDIAKQKNHGRNVAGIVHAVAPGAQLLTFNVFRHTSDGKYSARRTDVLAALDDLSSFSGSYDIVAVNLSLGSERYDARPCNDSDYFDPFRTLWQDEDILAAVSTGNDGHLNWLGSPSCETPALGTAAQFDKALEEYDGSCFMANPVPGEVACFSNLNGMLDLVAPGAKIEAAGVTKSGTSMAAPHTAGAVALLQSAHLATHGALHDIGSLTRHLRILADPRPHDGLTFMQLDLLGAPQVEIFSPFEAWLAEAPQTRIGGDWNPHVEVQTIAAQGWSLAGLYLHLEVIHPSPQEVEVTLTSPQHTSIPFTLPAGTANFNGVVGKELLPGAFEAMGGEPVDGTWTLELRDLVTMDRGHYVSATIYWVAEGCQPICAPAEACGDDQCGGSCGSCGSDEYCDSQPGELRTCLACSADCDGKSCGPDRCGGSCGSCDDGLYCNGIESCTHGQCESAEHCVADELDCTELCSEEQDRCNAVSPGFCVIDGACVVEGVVRQDAVCQECDPDVHAEGWTSSSTLSCDDGDPCTVDDQCIVGVCMGWPKDCSALDGPCRSGSCDAASGQCETVLVTDGVDCDDGDGCTQGDACEAGDCQSGTPIECAPPDDCHEAGSCDPALGQCVHPPQPDGTPCPLGTCTNGTCIPTAVPPPATEEEGCSCTLPGNGQRGSRGWSAIALLALIRIRRAR